MFIEVPASGNTLIYSIVIVIAVSFDNRIRWTREDVIIFGGLGQCNSATQPPIRVTILQVLENSSWQVGVTILFFVVFGQKYFDAISFKILSL